VNVCEIGKERIRRAGKKIAEENATTAPNLDIGFRVLKVVDSPMVDASKSAGDTVQQELSFSSVKTDVTDDALLFHTLLRMGIRPTESIAYQTIEGNRVACVGGVALVAALDANTQMTNAFIEAVAKLNPGVAVFRDDTFRNNNALRISLEQTFKQLSKETKLEVI